MRYVFNELSTVNILLVLLKPLLCCGCCLGVIATLTELAFGKQSSRHNYVIYTN